MTTPPPGAPEPPRGSKPPRDFTLVVPRGWFYVPLLDAEQRRRSVAALVETTFRGVDDQPLLKRQTHAALTDMADSAVAGNGIQLYVSLDAVAGVPLPASLVVSLVSPFAGAYGADAVAPHRLADDLARPGAQTDIVELPAGLALRRRTRRRLHPANLESPVDATVVDPSAIATAAATPGPNGSPSESPSPSPAGPPPPPAPPPPAGDAPVSGDAPVMSTTVLEYFVPIPTTGNVLLLSFSTPLEALADAFVELFDAIAGTLRWKP